MTQTIQEEYIFNLASFSEKNFDSCLQKLSLHEPENLLKIKEYLDNEYYNSDRSLLPDERYDKIAYIVNNTLKQKNSIGAPPKSDEAVKLPIWMGSLDKIKFDEPDKLSRWLEKYKQVQNVIITPKLDGLSCLIEKKNGVVKLYTRGDGKYGTDITVLLNYMDDLSSSLKEFDTDCLIRGELIINTKLFSKKYANLYKNARQLVAGVVNCKSLDLRGDIAKDIEFIPYEIIFDKNDLCNPQCIQLSVLEEFFTPPKSIKIPTKTLNLKTLEDILKDMRDKSEFYIDGIVITLDISYQRNIKDNPDYSFAFKLQGEVAEAIVQKVEWNVSKNGLLKPIVHIKPLDLSGITISKTTGFNGKYILENKIGPGACIKITRSGDVIPYIVEVTEPAIEASMPDQAYEWNETHVDIIAVDGGDEMEIAQLVSFFQKIQADGVSQKTIEKLYNNGYTTLKKILDCNISDFLKMERMAQKSAENLYSSIHQSLNNLINNAYTELNEKKDKPCFISFSRLLAASGKMGANLGERKLVSLFEGFPEIVGKNREGFYDPFNFFFTLDMSEEDLLKKIFSIKGFSGKTTTLIIENLGHAKIFLNFIKNYWTEKAAVKKHSEEKEINNEITPMNIVFSGFRDKLLEDKISKLGISVKTTINSNTNILVLKNLSPEKESSKASKAKELGITIMSLTDFKNKYKL
jgi:NAD-dependent DNA ligase